MKIHLLRHADAEDMAATDSARRLTAKGEKQAAQVGEYLHHRRVAVDLIVSSPYLRAVETARLVKQKLSSVQLLEDIRLGCGLAPETGLEIIRELKRFDNILIVGHQPDLGELAAYLLTEDKTLAVHFQKAAMLSMDLTGLNAGAGVLEWFLPVKMMS